jgi:tetratricopeptide (TPR) repeat protein
MTREFAPVLGLAFAAFAAIACGSAHGPGPSPKGDELPPAPAPPPPKVSAILPEDARELYPSQMRLLRPQGGHEADLGDVETCASCHEDAAAQWRTSAHSFASFNNPVYRASVERFRKVAGNETSRFCGGCHDPALMAAGGMLQAIEPHDPNAHVGISCRTCHGIQSVRPDGDASYDLSLAPIPLPKDGDEESVRVHKRAAAPSPLRTSALCGACHRVFLDEGTGNAHHIPGQDEASEWQRSAFAGMHAQRVDHGVAKMECQGCHMAKEPAPLGDRAAKDGKIASHRFLGGHTFLAAMRGDADTEARIAAFMRKAVSVDVAAMTRATGARVLLPEGASATPGEALTFDVVVRNLGVGHRFPGGVLDAQDTWVELTIATKNGRKVAEAGTNEGATGQDGSAHVLRAVLLDGDGQPVTMRETDKFRTTVTNHTIPARDAEVARFSVELPKELPASAFPLVVIARLVHRSRSLAVQKLACDDAASPRARAFAEAQRRLFTIKALGDETLAPALDACKMQPILELGRASLEIGPGADPARKGDAFERAYGLGLGLGHALQERVEEARGPLVLARMEARTPEQRAMAEGALALLAARQGRVEETFEWAERAGKVFPGHPALERARGEALGTVWRLADAAPYLRRSAEGAALDDTTWARLAVDLGGAGFAADALLAAQKGVALQPRDPDCLRVQALAMETLGYPKDEVDAAKEAYFVRRPPDDAPAIKAKCSAKVPGCALERDPVHVHPMRIVWSPHR